MHVVVLTNDVANHLGIAGDTPIAAHDVSV
jgi:hypothetical protein